MSDNDTDDSNIFESSDVEEKDNAFIKKKEDYLDRPSTDRDVREGLKEGLKEYVTKDEEKYNKQGNYDDDIQNIKEFYGKLKKYNKKYIPLRKKLIKERDLAQFNSKVMKITCYNPNCTGGKGIISKKNIEKEIIDDKFIVKQNKLIITRCEKCREDKVYKINSYKYLYNYLKVNKKKIKKIKRLLSIQKNELVNELFQSEENDDIEMEYSLYEDFKRYYLNKDKNIKIIENKLLSNKNKIFTKKIDNKSLDEFQNLLKEKMEEYKERSQDNSIDDKVYLYNEILKIKDNIRILKYNKINCHKNDNDDILTLKKNEDIEYPEIYDITEDDNSVSEPYLELKKNKFNIPDSLQILL